LLIWRERLIWPKWQLNIDVAERRPGVNKPDGRLFHTWIHCARSPPSCARSNRPANRAGPNLGSPVLTWGFAGRTGSRHGPVPDVLLLSRNERKLAIKEHP